MTKYRTHFTTFASVLFVAVILSGTFLLTKGTDPSVSELAFTERSSFALGSVVPASCESGVDHDVTKTCYDTTISTCSTCTATCDNGGLDADQCWCTNSMDAYASTYYTDECCTTLSGGSKCGTKTRTCANGGLSASECCASGTTWDGSSCVAPSQSCTTTTYSYTELQADGCTVKSWDSDNTVCSNPTSSTWDQGPFSYDSSSCATPPTECPSGYTGTYPNCTAPAETCADGSASNYGGSLPCVYPTTTCPAGYSGTYPDCVPVYTATLSQSSNTTLPNESFTITWGWAGMYPSGCTVSYTGPNGGGTISDGPRTGTQAISWATFGTYRITNTCYSVSGQSGSASVDHDVTAPDLTAGAITPTTAMVGKSTKFTSLISNIGGKDTGVGFFNFLQHATEVDGGGIITDEEIQSMASLGGAKEKKAEIYYTFTTTGTYSLRICADKTNRNSAGNVTEMNTLDTAEDNNCGPWTTITVTNGECVLPWGGMLPNGSTTTAYNRSTTLGGDSCDRHDQSRKCSDGILSGSYPYGSCGPAVPTVLGFGVSPRTVERGGLVKINWSIQNPTSSCKVTAAVQIPAACDATCQSNRATASSTLNTLLKTGTTNSNDPNGANRNMTAALTTSVSGYAKGEKTVTLDYSTTFTLTCGAASNTVKSLIYVTDRTEG